MKIWIDDVRPAPDGWIWCKSVNEAKSWKICVELLEEIIGKRFNMKIWKTLIEEDKYLETTINRLEKDGAHVKEVIPYFFCSLYSTSGYYTREYKIIYIVEEETNE